MGGAMTRTTVSATSRARPTVRKGRGAEAEGDGSSSGPEAEASDDSSIKTLLPHQGGPSTDPDTHCSTQDLARQGVFRAALTRRGGAGAAGPGGRDGGRSAGRAPAAAGCDG